MLIRLVCLCLFFSLLHSASLTKNGAGTLTLTGNSSVTLPDPVTSNAGILIVDTTLGSPTGLLTFGTLITDTPTLRITGTPFSSARSVTLNGAATFNIDAGTSTFSGVISGAGSLTKTNTAATLILGSAMPNTFSGGTTIQGGTLSLAGASALPNNGNVTLQNAAAVLLNDNNQNIGGLTGSALTTVNTGVMGATVFSIGNGGATSTFSGVISGSGQVEKDGAGTLTLLGANTYAGLTTVTAGTLVGNTTSLQGGTAGRNITDNALLIFDQGFDGTYENIITGSGNLTKQNSGIFTLTGTVSLLSPASTVTVQGGTLSVIVPGIVGANTITIQAGTTLRGTGTLNVLIGVGGKVDVFGTCFAGTSIGTLHILGDYVQEAGSTLEVELDPAGNVDLIDATGTVTINGGTLHLIPEFGTYNPHTQYTIISAASVVVNSPFDPVTSTLPSFEAEVFYFPTKVVLLVNIEPLSNLIHGGNAAQVARCLDQFPLVQGGDIDTVIDFLHFMTLAQIRDTLNQMQPSLFNALDLCEEETLVKMRSSLSRRQAYLFFRGCGPKRSCQGWADLFRVQSEQSNEGEEPGFRSTTLAAVTGFDYLWEQSCLGGAFGYAKDDLNWKKNRGSGSVNSYYGMLYGSWNPKSFYAQFALIGAANDEKASRQITFVGTEFEETIRHAKHNQWGAGALSNVEMGFLIGNPDRDVQVQPFGRVDYVFVHRWPFQEQGANSIDLDVEAHNADLLRMETGFRFSKCVSFRTSRFDPYAQIGGAWEKRYHGTTSQGSFVHSSCVMTVEGLNPNRSLLLLSCGFAIRCCQDHLLLSTDFEKEWGNHYHDTIWTFRTKLEF